MEFITKAGHKCTLEMWPTPEAIVFSVQVENYAPADAADVAAALALLKNRDYPGDTRPLKLDESAFDQAHALLAIAKKAYATAPVGRKQRKLRERTITTALAAVQKMLGREGGVNLGSS